LIKSGLIDAFKSFSPKEIKDFSEFVSSPYFNKNLNVVKLFEVIRKNYPAFDNEKMEKEKVFKKIFPGKPYKDSTMRLLMHYLYYVVEKYLAYTRFSNNEYLFKDTLFYELQERRLYRDLEKTIDQVNAELDKVNIRDDEYYRNRFIFAEHKLDYLGNIYLGKYEKYLTKENLEYFTDNITNYYLISVLKYYSITLNTMYLYNVKIDTAVFERILSNFDPEQFKNVPLIIIYYNIIMLFIKPEEIEYYNELKELVVKYENNIGHLIGDLYINLENYCHRKIREGKLEFTDDVHYFYKLELNKGTYISHGCMPNTFYTSCVVNGCRMTDYDWVRKFIEKYRDELHEDSRDAYYYYGLAFLENELKNYEKALQHLAKVKSEELYLKMDIRQLQCRIYYSLVWNIPLQSLLETFKKTIQNNKFMTESRKIQYMKFIRYLTQLNNFRYKGDVKGYSVLKDELDKDSYFTYKPWITEAARELLAKSKNQ